jgi:pimeloyl-ACP methyl ester carboxylesterase
MDVRSMRKTLVPERFAPKRLLPRSGTPARRVATWSLLPLGMLGGFLGARALQAPRGLVLEPALDAPIEALELPFGRAAYYAGGTAEGAPLLLLHSVNASANSYETKPLFDHYAETRPVYALELPGFGFSDRPDRIYTPRLMTDAIMAMVEEIRRRHGHFPIDVIALSLSCEFLARAAADHPTFFRTLGLISPTGFETKRDRQGAEGATFGRASTRDIVSFPLWGRPLFDVLTSRPSMRFFLEKTWGSKRIDDGLLDYSYVSAHQDGAEHAPFSFLTGYLFSTDALTCYKELTVPVWMCHGIRGDFVNFSRKVDVVGKPNWTVEVFPTGALPHFERLAAVVASYGAFLGAVA